MLVSLRPRLGGTPRALCVPLDGIRTRRDRHPALPAPRANIAPPFVRLLVMIVTGTILRTHRALTAALRVPLASGQTSSMGCRAAQCVQRERQYIRAHIFSQTKSFRRHPGAENAIGAHTGIRANKRDISVTCVLRAGTRTNTSSLRVSSVALGSTNRCEGNWNASRVATTLTQSDRDRASAKGVRSGRRQRQWTTLQAPMGMWNAHLASLGGTERTALSTALQGTTGTTQEPPQTIASRVRLVLSNRRGPRACALRARLAGTPLVPALRPAGTARLKSSHLTQQRINARLVTRAVKLRQEDPQSVKRVEQANTRPSDMPVENARLVASVRENMHPHQWTEPLATLQTAPTAQHV